MSSSVQANQPVIEEHVPFKSGLVNDEILNGAQS